MQAFTTQSFSSLIRARLNTEFFPRQHYVTRKRFYRNTGIVQSDSKWEVTLDHRRLKTPNGSVLSVSSEPLARAVAAEWDAQLEHITQPTMHLVKSAYIPNFQLILISHINMTYGHPN
ncbi:ATP synthase mitochondrial F1 complex assembly factor 2-like isoform X1 [Cydia pomonella]|uniref:ATP synthase mitochondrial F1 complex assembly factor 2-like isoform X1 n=1 Tax=Cydia pomonella TaxID=82600 RepID=UPI002ADE44A5|nr:ATP synthase mitochondrial F1 complex assembly factor 2-like isoform X1 [Cydia pomonella]